MYFNLLKDVAKNIKNKLIQVKDKPNATLIDNRDKTNLVKFYCFLHEYGKDVFDWEVETFELVLGNKGFEYTEIMDMVGMVYIVNNADYVLSNRDHFENAVQLLNDLYLDTSTTELQSPHNITWAIICILILFNTDNLPIIGDAANYIIESFEENGWTQPPAFLLNTELGQNFENIHKEYYDIIKKMSFQEFGSKALSVGEPKNGFENYLKHHAPIVKYVDDRLKITNQEINEILHKG